jgi:N-acetylmuramoyl-L-alanine amidase
MSKRSAHSPFGNTPEQRDLTPRRGLAPSQFRRREFLQASGALLFAASSPLFAQSSSIVAVRVWPAKDYTRVTLELEAPLKFSHQVIKNPDRLVVDIEDLELSGKLKDLVAKINPNDPYIGAVRAGQYKPRVVRLVFDLKAEINPQVFALKPVGEYGHRLVLDLYPLNAPDPMMALLDKREVPRDLPADMVPKGLPEPAIKGLEKLPSKVDAKGESKGDAKADTNTDAKRDAKADTKSDTKSDTKTDTKSDTAKTDVAKTEQSGRVGEPRDAKSDPRPVVARLVTIALDPGHGGEDPGAVGKRGTYEKNVTLAVAQRLRAKIDAEPNMRCLLTRDSDYFVPLHVRVQKARRVQADLFVSIHADAWIKPTAKGSSVFALSEKGATSSAAGWLAKKENDADLIGGVNLGTTDKDLARVLLDLSTTAQINDSLKLGRHVLGELGGINSLHKAHVEQAGFAVLKAPDIPSILIETAFISNPEEEKRLNDEVYQEKMANAILKGIRTYFSKNPPLAKSKMALLDEKQ